MARALRAVVGLLMVTGGVSLAVPLVTLAARSWSAGHGPQDAGAASPAAPARPLTDWLPPAPADLAATPEPAPAPAPRPDYRPPAPPEPLPPVAAPLALAAPGLGNAYRSTLDVPPPQLLDAEKPPPLAVSWSAQDAPRPAAPAHVMPAALVPATYRVRDGDDLPGIADRLYGNPAAASAVWAANRDVIPDPSLLPIGAELRLPPPWSFRIGGDDQGAIAPAAPRPALRTVSAPALAPAAPTWLDAAVPVPAPAAVPAAPAVSPFAPRSGGTVRVGPGETLTSLAQRLYGDPSAAHRLWEANRDRLRSPALLVPGIELRLP